MKRDANDILREEGPDALREAFDSSIEQQKAKRSGRPPLRGLPARGRTSPRWPMARPRLGR
jgi:hypothetical protein